MQEENGSGIAKEGEKGERGIHRSPDFHARARMSILSSRAASLLDEQEEEEEEQFGGPSLEIITDDETSISTSNSGMPLSPSTPQLQGPASLLFAETCAPRQTETSALVLSPVKEDNPGIDTLVRFTEGVSNYLCPVSVDASTDTDARKVQVQTNKTIQSAHSRTFSDTEDVQRFVSSGSCGTASPLCGRKNSSSPKLYDSQTDLTAAGGGLTTPLQTNAACTDLSLQDMRRLVAADISRLLGSTTGSTKWLFSLRDWLTAPLTWKASNSTGSSYRMPVPRNRCGLRSAQANRMHHLWFQWHPGQDQDTREEQQQPRRAAHLISPQHATVSPRPTHWSLSSIKSMEDIDDTSEMREGPPISELYYDSDPEVFRHTRLAASNARIRQVKQRQASFVLPSPIDTAASFANGFGLPPVVPRNSQGKSPPSFDQSFSQSRSLDEADPNERGKVDINKFDLRDDEMVAEFLKVSKAGGMKHIFLYLVDFSVN
jgi:hypothetical protein